MGTRSVLPTSTTIRTRHVGALILAVMLTLGSAWSVGPADSSSAVSALPASTPSVTGAIQVGGFASVDPLAPAAASYQWFADGQPIEGATAARIVIRPDLEGKRLSVAPAGQAPTDLPQTDPVAPAAWRSVAWPWPDGLFLEDVSCPSPTQCFAVSSDFFHQPRALLSFDGTAWTTIATFSLSDQLALSCSADGFCLMLHGSRSEKYRTFTNGVWSASKRLPPTPTTRNGIAWGGRYLNPHCASKSFCAVELGGGYQVLGGGGSGGFLMTYDPTANTTALGRRLRTGRHDLNELTQAATKEPGWFKHWSLPRQVTPSAHLHAMSCTGPTECLVLDADPARGTSVGVFDGRTSTRFVRAVGVDTEVGCYAVRGCVALSPFAKKSPPQVWNGTKWSAAPVANAESAEGLSCQLGVGCSAVLRVTVAPGEGLSATRSTVLPVFAELVGGSWQVRSVVTFEPGFKFRGSRGFACSPRLCVAANPDAAYALTR